MKKVCPPFFLLLIPLIILQPILPNRSVDGSKQGQESSYLGSSSVDRDILLELLTPDCLELFQGLLG